MFDPLKSEFPYSITIYHSRDEVYEVHVIFLFVVKLKQDVVIREQNRTL